jgi:prolyl-tRNA synthetase
MVGMVSMSTPEEILACTGGPLGFSGPIGLKGIRVIADERTKGMENFVVGANEADYHYTNANLGRDFTVADYADLVLAREGDACVKCGKPVSITQGIEVGQIFELGTKYSVAMDATYLEHDGQQKPFVMGCYGIGITRTVAAVIEQNHDANGIIWPLSVAPYEIEVLPVNVNDEVLRKAGEDVYERLRRRGLEVLLDDRDQRPGFKFKDADLIGLPVRIVIGEKAMAEGKVEIHVRRTGETTRVLLDQAADTIQSLIADKKIC